MLGAVVDKVRKPHLPDASQALHGARADELPDDVLDLVAHVERDDVVNRIAKELVAVGAGHDVSIGGCCRRSSSATQE
jgi:hypothetical protein